MAVNKKLYPPYLEGTIPAFYVNGTQAYLSVPFSMNKAVNLSDFSGINIKIKTVQSNELLFNKITDVNELDYIRDNLKANFTINLNEYTKFKPGNFYKVQIAYCDNTAARTPGYYSTVGVVKLTTKPTVTIAGLKGESSNVAASKLTYTGVYQQLDDFEDMDVSEKVYEYCFNLYKDDVLLASSEWQLHNSSTDIASYESTDEYSFTYSLEPNTYYQVEYMVRTINGLEVSSGKYTIMDKSGVQSELEASFVYDINFDNAYINLSLVPFNTEHNYANGAFLLTRASDEDNFTNWYELSRFQLRNADKLNEWNFKDFTIEHGRKYMYSLQQYNSKGLYSKRIYAENNGERYAIADFEDAFLYDGEKQLKIRFNPKVSSFKADKLEQKVETIGSKYPFIFRNAKVDYKEFPIAGLISYNSDEANLFMTEAELGLTENYSSKPRSEIGRTKAANNEELKFKPRTTSLESYNIAAERIFKMTVLDWLNNGKPKLFKSPVEGNFLVRLMNISLTPEEKTGRMLHNFQATAYEINDCSYKTLNNYGIVSIVEPTEIQYRLMTLDLSDREVRSDYENSGQSAEDIEILQQNQQEVIADLQEQIAITRLYLDELSSELSDANISIESKREKIQKLYQAHLELLSLESKLQIANEESQRLATIQTVKKYNKYLIEEYIEFRDFLPGTTFYIWDNTAGKEFSVTIGVTGSYTVFLEGHTFQAIRTSDLEEPPTFGLITYKYLAQAENMFEKIYDIDLEQTLSRQFIGGPNGTVIVDTRADSDLINDIKRELISFYYTKFSTKPIEEIYQTSDGSDMIYRIYDSKTGTLGNQILDTTVFSPINIYKIYTSIDTYSYKLWEFNSVTNDYHWVGINNVDYSITIDDETLIIEPNHEEELISHLMKAFNDQAFKYLRIGNGVILDSAYTTSVITYNIEITDAELQEKMRVYLQLLEQYNDSTNETDYHSQAFYEQSILPAWDSYCLALKNKL